MILRKSAVFIFSLLLLASLGQTASQIFQAIGIQFPATQVTSTNANTLDDYEEGVWTPAVRGSGDAGTYELLVASGSYTKIGNTVMLFGTVTLAGAITGGGSGNLQISGLPFAVSSATDYSPGSVWMSGVDVTNGTINIVIGFASDSDTKLVTFETNDAGGASNTPISGVGINDQITFFIVYLAAN